MIDSLYCQETNSNRIPSISTNINPAAQKASSIFLNKLPCSWITKEINSNSISYDIEITDKDYPKGIVFSALVKGTSTLNIKGDFINIALETSKLKYYVDNVNTPVFLILTDLNRTTSFWLYTQGYVSNTLDKKTPSWRNLKTVTLQIPLFNELPTSLDEFRNTVIYGLESIYLKNFHRFYYRYMSRLEQFYNSPEEMKHALQTESARQNSSQSAQNSNSCSCSSNSTHSCQEANPLDKATTESNDKIQNSMEYAQNLKLLDPKENRIAYYQISEALDLYASSASAGVRYTAMGELPFYDYLLHFMKSFEAMGTKAIVHLTNTDDHMRYFNAMEELTDIICIALDEGELIAASMLAIRLADTYLFASPYINRTFGQEAAAPLMDFAQTILVQAHEMATLVESPAYKLQ